MGKKKKIDFLLEKLNKKFTMEPNKTRNYFSTLFYVQHCVAKHKFKTIQFQCMKACLRNTNDERKCVIF